MRPDRPSDRERAIQYANARLDRAADRRPDTDWLRRVWRSGQARLVVVWREHHLLSITDNGAVEAVRLSLSASLEVPLDQAVFLGIEPDQSPLFAVDLSASDQQPPAPSGDARFVELRRYGPLLTTPDAGILAYARAMLNWHRNHQFCGRCGSATVSEQGGHRRRCRNADCQQVTFPRTDPAIIVLVEHPGSDGGPPRCLLGRSPHWPPGTYSTLAGFVEPGESLENAVRREVREEAGIRVGRVDYLASQPWPFPGSLMLGFQAQAVNVAIERQDDELEDVRWFGLDELAQAGEWDDGSPLCLPRKDSIARFLIDQWRERQANPGQT
ncbi:MAG: NAD(+) diphosphatase [Wenzhouxiangella sp.]